MGRCPSRGMQLPTETLRRPMDPLVHRMCRAPEQLTDLGVGKLLPHRKAQHLLIRWPQPVQRIEHRRVGLPAHHNRLRLNRAISRRVCFEGIDQDAVSGPASVAITNDMVGGAVQPRQRLVTDRYIGDPPPRHQKSIRSAIDRLVAINTAQTVRIHLPLIRRIHPPEPILCNSLVDHGHPHPFASGGLLSHLRIPHTVSVCNRDRFHLGGAV